MGTILIIVAILAIGGVFAYFGMKSGKIEDIEYTIYLKWFDELIENLKVDGIIYLN